MRSGLLSVALVLEHLAFLKARPWFLLIVLAELRPQKLRPPSYERLPIAVLHRQSCSQSSFSDRRYRRFRTFSVPYYCSPWTCWLLKRQEVIITPKHAKMKALVNQADIATGSLPNSAVQNAGSVSDQRFAPRLLNRQQAAEYCGLSPSAFSSWIRSRKLPPSLPGTTRWDLKAIDFALDAMSSLQKQEVSV